MRLSFGAWPALECGAAAKRPGTAIGRVNFIDLDAVRQLRVTWTSQQFTRIIQLARFAGGSALQGARKGAHPWRRSMKQVELSNFVIPVSAGDRAADQYGLPGQLQGLLPSTLLACPDCQCGERVQRIPLSRGWQVPASPGPAKACLNRCR
jgi:hypothetical protein